MAGSGRSVLPHARDPRGRRRYLRPARPIRAHARQARLPGRRRRHLPALARRSRRAVRTSDGVHPARFIARLSLHDLHVHRGLHRPGAHGRQPHEHDRTAPLRLGAPGSRGERDRGRGLPRRSRPAPAQSRAPHGDLGLRRRSHVRTVRSPGSCADAGAGRDDDPRGVHPRASPPAAILLESPAANLALVAHHPRGLLRPDDGPARRARGGGARARADLVVLPRRGLPVRLRQEHRQRDPRGHPRVGHDGGDRRGGGGRDRHFLAAVHPRPRRAHRPLPQPPSPAHERGRAGHSRDARGGRPHVAPQPHSRDRVGRDFARAQPALARGHGPSAILAPFRDSRGGHPPDVPHDHGRLRVLPVRRSQRARRRLCGRLARRHRPRAALRGRRALRARRGNSASPRPPHGCRPCGCRSIGAHAGVPRRHHLAVCQDHCHLVGIRRSQDRHGRILRYRRLPRGGRPDPRHPALARRRDRSPRRDRGPRRRRLRDPAIRGFAPRDQGRPSRAQLRHPGEARTRARARAR